MKLLDGVTLHHILYYLVGRGMMQQAFEDSRRSNYSLVPHIAANFHTYTGTLCMLLEVMCMHKNELACTLLIGCFEL